MRFVFGLFFFFKPVTTERCVKNNLKKKIYKKKEFTKKKSEQPRCWGEAKRKRGCGLSLFLRGEAPVPQPGGEREAGFGNKVLG